MPSNSYIVKSDVRNFLEIKELRDLCDHLKEVFPDNIEFRDDLHITIAEVNGNKDKWAQPTEAVDVIKSRNGEIKKDLQALLDKIKGRIKIIPTGLRISEHGFVLLQFEQDPSVGQTSILKTTYEDCIRLFKSHKLAVKHSDKVFDPHITLGKLKLTNDPTVNDTTIQDAMQTLRSVKSLESLRALEDIAFYLEKFSALYELPETRHVDKAHIVPKDGRLFFTDLQSKSFMAFREEYKNQNPYVLAEVKFNDKNNPSAQL